MLSLLRASLPRNRILPILTSVQQRWLAVPQRRKPHGRGNKGGPALDTGQLRNKDLLSGGWEQLRVVAPDGETVTHVLSSLPLSELMIRSCSLQRRLWRGRRKQGWTWCSWHRTHHLLYARCSITERHAGCVRWCLKPRSAGAVREKAAGQSCGDGAEGSRRRLTYSWFTGEEAEGASAGAEGGPDL